MQQELVFLDEQKAYIKVPGSPQHQSAKIFSLHSLAKSSTSKSISYQSFYRSYQIRHCHHG